MSKLFISGLGWNTDDKSLVVKFGEFGVVIEALVDIDSQTGRSKGTGSVTFASEEDATRAMEAMDGVELDGRRIRVDNRPGHNGGGYSNRYKGGGYNDSGYGDGGY
ncbi:hypothetical protein N7467_002121, partial [Penicillium canescens]